MDKKELEKGMNDAKKEEGGLKAEGGEDSPEWAPSIDWVMDSVGPFFNNNRGLGELLLDKLNENGVNTEGVALAGMVNVLQQFNKEYKELGKALGSNLDRIEALESRSEDLADAVRKLLKEMNVSEDEGAALSLEGEDGGGLPPPEAGDMAAPPEGDIGGGMPPDMGAPPAGDMGGMSPDMGASPAGDMGGMPPDMGAPPAGGMGGMPPDMGAAPPPDMGAGVVSDENAKNVERHVLSDERLKRVAGKVVGAYMKRKNSSKLDSSIISACSRRD